MEESVKITFTFLGIRSVLKLLLPAAVLFSGQAQILPTLARAAGSRKAKEDNSCRDGRYRPSGAAASAQSPRPRFALAFGLRYAPTAELSVYLST